MTFPDFTDYLINMLFPSSEELIQEAKKLKSQDLNDLHSKTYDLMMKHKAKYYEEKVDTFLKKTSIKEPYLDELRKKMLESIVIDDITYSNFMEEASRRISQTFQVISGNIAELCVESALNEVELKNNIHYLRKKERTDFTFYYPNLLNKVKIHRLEVKNVKLRERGARGLAFDGDSMLGFFNDPGEFTSDNIRIIDAHCTTTNGYCYVPPNTLKLFSHSSKRFKNNLEMANDMKHFVENGIMP